MTTRTDMINIDTFDEENPGIYTSPIPMNVTYSADLDESGDDSRWKVSVLSCEIGGNVYETVAKAAVDFPVINEQTMSVEKILTQRLSLGIA